MAILAPVVLIRSQVLDYEETKTREWEALVRQGPGQNGSRRKEGRGAWLMVVSD